MVITEQQQQKRPLRQLELFEERLPHRPFCSDSLDKGLLIRPKKIAIKNRYIQHNPPQLYQCLVFDFDRRATLESAGAADFIDANSLPTPNLIATSPVSGNAHIYYLLETPVCTSDLARKKPLVLLAKIEHALKEKLGADAGYTGLISKNPTHAYWRVENLNAVPWGLVDFLDWLDLPAKLPKKARTEGLGRNCTLFEVVRLWAYREVLAYRLAGKKDAWMKAVLKRCEDENLTFSPALPYSEIRSTAKSISKWVWDKYNGKRSMSNDAWAEHVAKTHTPEIQRQRQKKQVSSRVKASQAVREKALEMKKEGKKQKYIALALGVSEPTICRWLKAVDKS